MGIKNFSTKVQAVQTVSEIQMILAGHNAQSVSIDYENGQPQAVRFSLRVGTEDFWFRLPCNPEGVLKTMVRDNVEGRYRTIEQARNSSWRIIKDWLHAQVAIIDAGQVKAAEVFMPYMLEATGETLYEKFENQQLRLGSGG